MSILASMALKKDASQTLLKLIRKSPHEEIMGAIGHKTKSWFCNHLQFYFF
jgi:hypothetical protein